MVDDTQKLIKLIAKGYKFIETKFEDYKEKSGNKEFDDVQFLIDYDYQADLWEKAVIRVLKTYNKQNYLIEFQRPSNIKPSRHIYLTEEAENRIAAQLTVLRKILTEVENEEITPNIKKKVAYQITYNDNRELMINGRFISRLQSDSRNENLLSFLMANPNIVHKVKDIEKLVGDDNISTNIHHILSYLGFNKKAKNMFFPGVDTEKVILINPITRKYMIDNNLSDLDLDEICTT